MDRFVSHYADGGLGKYFAVEATMGAGKSSMAAWMADYMLNDASGTFDVNHVLCLVPWKSIQGKLDTKTNDMSGMLDKFDREFGLDSRLRFFTSDRRQVRQPIPHCEATITLYHEVCNEQAVETLRMWKETGWKFALICDEIHHTNESEGAWGEYVAQIADEAECVVTMSGTWFRSDEQPIKFIQYGENGKPHVDFRYTYPEGIRDRVVRDAGCQYFDATVNLFNHDTNEAYTVKASEVSNRKDLMASMKEVLDPQGECVREMILTAHADLMRLRRRFPDAAYLFVCRPGRDAGQEDRHIHQVVDTIKRLTSEKPIWVTHKDRDAQAKIDLFSGGMSPYLVAVNMISEGCDIPRLRGVVFCRHTESEMLFRQIVGRSVRMHFRNGVMDEDGTAAQIYVPKFPLMFQFGQNLTAESLAGVQQRPVCSTCGQWPCVCPCPECGQFPCACEKPDRDRLPASVEALDHVPFRDGGGIDGNKVKEESMQLAAYFIRSKLHMMHANLVQIGDLIQQFNTMMSTATSTAVDDSPMQRREKSRRKVNRLVNKIAGKKYDGDFGKCYKLEVERRFGAPWREILNTWGVDELEYVVSELKQRLEEVMNNG